jgi:hypothetical protein
MKGTLTNYSKFSEIKEYFEVNKNELPITLDGQCKYYLDVKFTVNAYIYQVESEIERLGDKIGRSTLAKAAKGTLYTLYQDLQNLDGWNEPMQKLGE